MKTLCFQRINKDIKEISKFPLEGIGIVSLDNDPMKYVVNIKIMSGVYEGYCLQLLLTFSDNYPINPPKILIYPGQSFDNIYHHHIFRSELKDEKDRYFNKFCFDLLQNDFLSTSSEKYSGWNPSYTIITLLLQVQIFLSKPDFPTGYIPPKEKIDELMKSMDSYEKIFIIKNENNEEITKIHTWKNPYPEMYFKDNKKIEIDKKENKNDEKLKEIKEYLTCFVTKLNYLDDKNLLLGYPIKRIGNGGLIPIPEILSYNNFIQESPKNNCNNGALIIGLTGNGGNHRNRNTSIFGDNFKSANNEFYDTWLPIYINEKHFEKNKTTILNYFSILKFGDSGLKKFDFHPQYIFEIMPNILAEMIIKMTKEKISSAFLKCFFQNILMFKKLEKKYNNIFMKYRKLYFEIKINKFLKENGKINIIKEIIELLILFYYCDNKFKNNNIKKKFENYLHKLKNLMCLYSFEKKDNFIFKDQNEFIKDLKKNKLFDKIVDIIFLDSDYLILSNKDSLLHLSEILRNKIIKEMNKNFKGLYIKLNEKTKTKIKKIIINELNFSSYFDINLRDFEAILPEMYQDSLFKTFNFILVFKILREKVLDKNFFRDLANNYGVYLNNEAFIEILNNEIKNGENINNFYNSNKKNNLRIFSGNKSMILIRDIFNLDLFTLFTENHFLFFNYRNNWLDEFNNYPFIKIDNSKEQKIYKISENIQNCLDKEKEICKKKNKIFSSKSTFIKDKTMKKIQREKIIIKKSYNKIFNKAKQVYNIKYYR